MKAVGNTTKGPDAQPAPTGTMAWVGFGCSVMSLACLCIAFCSPYWFQQWANSQNQFKNIGLWEVCFHNYMQFKDDSQQLYDGCWWLFDRQTKYYKLREWLIPPWFITCQVLTTGCLLVEIITCLVTGMIFLHFCPVVNHEYLQTYGVFASASMMFLVTMIMFVVAVLFGVRTNDRYWLPRPDQNFLSWGFGFLIISAIFALVAGIILFMEAQKTYDELLRREDEYTKAALDMSSYPLQQSYAPGYDAEYGPAGGYDAGGYAPQYGPSGTSQPSYEKDGAYGDTSYGQQMKYAPDYGPKGDAGQKFRSFDQRPTSYTSDDDGRGAYPDYSSSRA